MIEVDSAQREARAREMRHEVVAQLTVGTHRTFRILFAVQWPVALALAWNSALPGEARFLFTLILGGTLCLPALLFARAAPHAWWVRHFMALCQIGWSMVFMWLLEGHSEAQFHMFVSLVFLAFYRDWRVLVTATLAAIAYPIAAHRDAARFVRHRPVGLVARLRPGHLGGVRILHPAARGPREPEDGSEILRRMPPR